MTPFLYVSEVILAFQAHVSTYLFQNVKTYLKCPVFNLMKMSYSDCFVDNHLFSFSLLLFLEISHSLASLIIVNT